jgi:hypothetical protein
MQPTSSFKPRPGRGVVWYSAGTVLAGIAATGLFLQHAYLWLLCPPALAVMFYRQSLQPYDSLGAADVPELVVAVLYFPFVAGLLNRAQRKGELRWTVLWIGIGHLVAIAIAIVAAKFRNEVWSYRLGS